MSDNSGSLSSVTEVLAYYSSLRSAFPGAKIIGSSLDAFYAEANKVKDQLPVVVTGEIGDVWIQVRKRCISPRNYLYRLLST